MSARLVHFPWLHPGLSCGALPDGVVFLDPGVPMDTDRPRWSPPDLPLSEAEIRRHVRGYLEFAERFPRATDMQAYQAAGLDNFFTDTAMDIRSQLNGDVRPEESSAADRRRQAQLVLALALLREEQFVAMSEQEPRFEQARAGFAKVLGLDEEETFSDFGLTDEAIFPRAGSELPWRSVLAPMACLLPENSLLFVSDADVVRELQSLDLEFTPRVVAGESLVCCRMDAETLERVCGMRVEPAVTLTIAARPPKPLT